MRKRLQKIKTRKAIRRTRNLALKILIVFAGIMIIGIIGGLCLYAYLAYMYL